MRITDIEQANSSKFPRIWDARAGTAGTTKIAAAFVHINGSVIVQADAEPQGLGVYLGSMPVMDWHDIEICSVGFNPAANLDEWVVNIECCGLIPVEMDYFDGIPAISKMLENSVPILDMFMPAKSMAFDADIVCKSIFIADYLDDRSLFISRPNTGTPSRK